MRSLPEVRFAIEPLMQMLHGTVRAKLLLTAVELRVFSSLTRPMGTDSLAGKIQTHPESTRVFLDALTANGLLCKRNGEYSNAPLAEAFLVEGRPTYLGDVLIDNVEWTQSCIEGMTDLVKLGPAAAVRPSHSIAWPREAEIHANCQRAGFAQRAAAIVSQLPEFPRTRKMLDLGAGPGLIGLAVVAAHPTMTGVLFDKPELVSVMQRFVREYELEERVTVVGGDFCSDPIGEGYDLIWTSYALSLEQLHPMLHKIRAALNPGGVFVSVAEGVTDEGTQPTAVINAMLHNNLTGRGRMYEEGQIAQAMLDCGFRSVHSRRTEALDFHGPATIDIARK